MGKPRKPPKPLCGAQRTHGKQPCRMHAGAGTDHPGEGHCRWHGGNDPVQAAAVRAFANSPEGQARKAYEELIRDKDISELITILKARGDVTNLAEDVQTARAITLDFVNRAKDLENALLRWSASWDKDWQAETIGIVEELRYAQLTEDWDTYKNLLGKVPDPMSFINRPRKVLDVGDAIRMFKDVATIVAQITAAEQAGSVPVRDVEILLVEVAGATERTIRHHVSDPAARDRLITALQSAYSTLRIEPWASHGDGSEGDQDRERQRSLDA